MSLMVGMDRLSPGRDTGTRPFAQAIVYTRALGWAKHTGGSLAQVFPDLAPRHQHGGKVAGAFRVLILKPAFRTGRHRDRVNQVESSVMNSVATCVVSQTPFSA
jgi:hypothetical protein